MAARPGRSSVLVPQSFVWRWRRTQYGPLANGLAERFGQRCRIFARGLNGSVGVEFEDGWRVVATRFAVGRRRE
jgi:hypothetical protein